MRSKTLFHTPNALRPHLAIIVIAFILSSCHTGRYFYWNLADTQDYKRFPSLSIQPSDQPKALPVAGNFVSPDFSQIYHGRFRNLEHLLSATSSLAFLIIHKDTILYEAYLQNYDSSSLIPSFSIAKSFVSVMVGLALRDGYIQDVDDPVTKYLPAGFDPSLQSVRVKDLLNMRAGLNFTEAYRTPFSPMAKYYYGRHLDKYVKDLRIVDEPGRKYEYQSAATQLLGLAIEYSSGKHLIEYLEESLWQPAGMANEATWSLDRKNGRGKHFCCLNATPRDFARFGVLLANEGKYNGEEVIPASWLEAMRQADPAFVDSQSYPYSYQWRITPEGGMFATGILGQYIYIHPGKDVVIVRMGRKSGNLDWGVLFRHLAVSIP